MLKHTEGSSPGGGCHRLAGGRGTVSLAQKEAALWPLGLGPQVSRLGENKPLFHASFSPHLMGRRHGKGCQAPALGT